MNLFHVMQLSSSTYSQKAEEIIKRLRNTLSPSNRLISYPLVVKEAHDCIVTDIEGKAYVDFNAGWTVAPLGYSNPEVTSAIETHLRRYGGVTSVSFPNETTVRFAERLIGLTPGTFPKRVWFGHSGTDACAAAYKFIPSATKKPRILSFFGGMHGVDLAGIAMSALPMYFPFSTPNLVTKIPYAYCYRCPFKMEYPGCGIYCASDFIEEQVFKYVNPPEDTSFMMVEPIQTDSGDIVPPDGYMQKLKKTCDKFGILFVSDEVKIGFGRTGKMWGIEHSNVVPDAVAMGKAMASGMPVGALVAKKELLEIGVLPTTLCGNAIGAAAGLATLDGIEKGKLAENATKMGHYLKKKLEEVKERHELIGDVRGKGLVLGVELVKNKKTKEPAKLEIAKTLFRAWQLGLLIGYVGVHNNVIEVVPPLTITSELIDKGVEIIDSALKDVESGLVSDTAVKDYVVR
jgi:4-aminobutyrate aminotransferase